MRAMSDEVERICVFHPERTAKAVQPMIECPGVMATPLNREQVSRLCKVPACNESDPRSSAIGACGSERSCFRRHWCLDTQMQADWRAVSEERAPHRTVLMRLLSNKRVAVLGDSMGRQSFATLVALLRRASESSACDRLVLDAGFMDTYVQATTAAGLVIDHFGSRSAKKPVQLPPHAGTWADEASHLLPWNDTRHTSGRAEPTGAYSSYTRVDFLSLRCWSAAEASALAATIATRSYDYLAIHAPAYHPLTGYCTAPEDGKLTSAGVLAQLERPGRPPNAFDAFWSTVADAVRHTSHPPRLLLITAPTEHIMESRTFLGLTRQQATALQQTFNDHLAGLVAPRAGALHGLGATLVDWAAHTRRTNPTPRGGGDWHYACGLLLRGDLSRWAYQQPPAHLKVASRKSGDCEEEGNTGLWRELIVPVLRRQAAHEAVHRVH